MDGEDSDALKDGNILVDALVNKFCLAQDKPKSKEDFNLWAWLLQFTNHKNFLIVLAISILFYAVLWLWNAQLRSFHHGNVELAKAIFRYFTPVTEVHGLVDGLTPYAIWSFYSGLMCVAIEFLLPSLVSWGWLFNSIPVLVFGVGYLVKDYLTDTVRQHFTTAAAFPFSVNNIVLLDGVEKKMRVVETNCKGFVRLKDCEGEEREHFVPIDRVLKSKITVIGNGGGGINAEAHNSDACFNAITAAFTKHALYVFLMGDGTAGHPGFLKVAWDSRESALRRKIAAIWAYIDYANKWLPLGWFLFLFHAISLLVPFVRPTLIYPQLLPLALGVVWILGADEKTRDAFYRYCKTGNDEDWSAIIERDPQSTSVDEAARMTLRLLELMVVAFTLTYGFDMIVVLPMVCFVVGYKLVTNLEKEKKIKSQTAKVMAGALAVGSLASMINSLLLSRQSRGEGGGGMATGKIL